MFYRFAASPAFDAPDPMMQEEGAHIPVDQLLRAALVVPVPMMQEVFLHFPVAQQQEHAIHKETLVRDSIKNREDRF